MKILIVGNDPHDCGGVANYTRPLAISLTELGHDVFYFYSGAWNRKYNWFMFPYLRINRKDFPFECAELINSPNWTYNYGNPLLDISVPSVERIFTKYIKKINPDVMHVHSRLGLPISIIEIAAKERIKIFNTIHVYGLLCQKRVMMDQDGRLCNGPLDLEKCTHCTGPLDIRKLKFVARMTYLIPGLIKFAVKIKKLFNRKKKKDCRDMAVFGAKKEQLKKRLDYAVKLMNEYVAMNICVSSDVKKTFMRYGIKEEKLLVQHIGSKIAEQQTRGVRQLHSPIVIGNIGGVDYYKGTQILIEAVAKLKRTDFKVKIFGKYDDLYIKNIMQGYEHLPVEFRGSYEYESLPQILSQIDIMVLPSICNDTLPQTVFESFSAGIPVICSNVGGFPDFVKNGINGYLFNPGDSMDLAEKLESILNEPKKIFDLSPHIPKLKTITENAQELISLYAA